MTKNELIDGLLAWAGEENVSVMIIAGDANGVLTAGHGTEDNLVKALADGIYNNETVKSVCTRALEMVMSQEVTKTIIANDYYDEE